MAEEQVILTLTNVSPPPTVVSVIATVAGLQAFFRTRRFEMEEEQVQKFLAGVRVECQTLGMMGQMLLEIYGSNRLNEVESLLATLELDGGDVPIWGNWPSMRYYSFRLIDTSVTGVWKLTALEGLGSDDGGTL